LRVNHSVDGTARDSLADQRQNHSRPAGVYVVIAAMLVYSIAAYGNLGRHLGGVAALFTSVMAYFLTIYLYYGIARLAYRQYTYLLWASAVAAVIVAFFLSGLSNTWVLLTGWGMLLFAGAATGRLTRAGYLQGQVYMIGAAIVAVFFALQSLPMWNEFLKAAPQLAKTFIEQLEQFLLGLGYSQEMIRDNLDQSKEALDVMIRLFPAATILGALLQFSIGYLAFVLWVGRREPSRRCFVPIVFWKVPFGFAPVLVIAILARLLGGESLQMIADNVLAILAAYYCVAGLALIEYYLKKLRVSKLLKVLFYVLLFFTQLAGFFVVALVGFADSFADWRKVQAQKAL
jgi:uncharacterized protein YybS (DUF2232 family)